MANVTLVIGGARSGKSSYASRLALTTCEAPVYLATARKFEGDEEFANRIALHKADRQADNWLSVEEEKELSKRADDFRGKAVVVDCLTLWLTNFFLDANNDGAAALTAVKAEASAENRPPAPRAVVHVRRFLCDDVAHVCAMLTLVHCSLTR